MSKNTKNSVNMIFTQSQIIKAARRIVRVDFDQKPQNRWSKKEQYAIYEYIDNIATAAFKNAKKNHNPETHFVIFMNVLLLSKTSDTTLKKAAGYLVKATDTLIQNKIKDLEEAHAHAITTRLE